MARHERGEAQVIPIVLRPCLWEGDVTPFGNLRSLPSTANSVTTVRNKDKAFTEIAKGISAIANSIKSKREKERKKRLKHYMQVYGKISRLEDLAKNKTAIEKLNRLRKYLNLSHKDLGEIQHLIQEEEEIVSTDRLWLYQQEVKLHLHEDDGFISPVSRLILDKIKNIFEIPARAAIEIENGEIKIFRTKKLNLNQYERAFLIALDESEALDQGTRQLLEKLARKLNLSSQDIVALEKSALEALSQDDDFYGYGSHLKISLKKQSRHDNTIKEFPSERGIDYFPLKKYLEQKDWKSADHETYLSILKIFGRNRCEPISRQDWVNLPETDLKTIDTLWTKYSRGRLGFSAQQRIWLSCEEKFRRRCPNQVIWEEFGRRVDWLRKNGWIYYMDIDFESDMKPGHLPAKIFTFTSFQDSSLLFSLIMSLLE